jgi:hypothetical protein
MEVFMRTRYFLIGTLALVIVIAGGFAWAWSTGWFDTQVHSAAATTSETTDSQTADLNEGLELARLAREKLKAVPGYRAIYLRDERIQNELQENYLKLAIRHEPFSVLMEWVEPKSKKGRKAAFVAGKNDNKMRVKVGILTMSLELDESIRRKESRHTLAEAGLKNMVERLVTSWDEELRGSDTTTRYSDATVQVILSGKTHAYPCRLVETTHTIESKGKYAFWKTRVYFSKDTGLPVRMEGYDWPSTSAPEGLLLERYTYLEVDLTAMPAEKEFGL